MAKKDRTDESTDIQRVAGIDPETLLKLSVEDTSFDDMKEYRVIPRLKVIQEMTEKILKKRFGEGALIIRPGDALVAKNEDNTVVEGPLSFDFVPLYFFVEFLKVSDLRDTESPTVVERSFDRGGELAKKAKNPSMRIEIYPGQESKDDDKKFRYRYVEALRFPGIIYGDHEMSDTAVVLSFERGEHNTGQNFCTAVKMRKQVVKTSEGDKRVGIPLYLQVWKIAVGFREFGTRHWYGLDPTPADNPCVAPEHIEMCMKEHQDLRELFDANRIRVDGDDRETEDVVVGGNDSNDSDHGKDYEEVSPTDM